MKEIKEGLKLLMYIATILHPNYGSAWFIIYMYLIYFRIAKRKVKFDIQIVPDEIILQYVKSHYIFNNVNNVVVASEQNLYKMDKLLKLVSETSGNWRHIYVIACTKCEPNKLFMNAVLFHNFQNNSIANPVLLRNCNERIVNIAYEIDVSLVATPLEIGNTLCETILGKYFNTPKLVAAGDLIEINVKQFAEDLFFTSSKINCVQNIYFKCNRVIFGKEEVTGTYFCVVGETSIKQSANVQCFLPIKTCKVASIPRPGCFKQILLCPYGLQDQMDSIQEAVKPFLKKRRFNLKPVFLIEGEAGSGREVLLRALTSHFGLHFYKVNNSDLIANVYAQNETKLRNVLFSGKTAAPCLIAIFNFENFGKNNDGQYDERLMTNFSDELKLLFDDNKFPIFLFCCSASKETPVYLKKQFLQTFKIKPPNVRQREQNLKWIIEERDLETNANLSEVASKTNGFLFEDLQALVYYAQLNNQHGGILDEDSFSHALDFMQANYNESLGAPKVPKVQWSDVGGLTEVKEEIIKTINIPLKYPELMKKSGLNRSGILLFGPPGTGKTLIAKAIATECGLCFLSVKGPELLNMYVGQSEQNIREVFDRARQASPCIIFFDELDSLAPNRGMSGDSGGVMDRVVSQLLAEMDGLNETATIFIIGATNRPDLIDPALLRPGRFDKLLYVGTCSDPESKLSVLKALTRKFKLSKEIDLADVIGVCPENITGADFYGICANAWASAVHGLIQKTESGQLAPEKVTSDDVIVTFDDFKSAIQNIKPSINEADLKYFEKLKAELSSIS